MRQNYLGGNYGYGHAKQELYELVAARFAKERELYNFYISNLPELDKKLQEGEARAREIARVTLAKVRKKLGYA